MYLLSQEEQTVLESCRINVHRDDKNRGYSMRNQNYLDYPRETGRMLVAYRESTARQSSNGIHALSVAEVIVFQPVIDGQIQGRFSVRVGSLYGGSKRPFANFHRKRALRRATKALGL